MTEVKDFVSLIRELNGSVYYKKNSEGNLIKVQCLLKPPTTIDHINSTDEELERKLPLSFKKFLLEFNGGRIFDYEGLYGFEIF